MSKILSVAYVNSVVELLRYVMKDSSVFALYEFGSADAPCVAFVSGSAVEASGILFQEDPQVFVGGLTASLGSRSVLFFSDVQVERLAA